MVQAVCQRLNIHRRKYWKDPNLGSRSYTLRRSKDVPRIVQLEQQYAEEALSDLSARSTRFSCSKCYSNNAEPSLICLSK